MLVCSNLARSRLQVLGPTYPAASCFYSSLAHSPSYQPSISQTTHSGTYAGMGSSEQRRGLSIYVDGKEVHTRDLVPSGKWGVCHAVPQAYHVLYGAVGCYVMSYYDTSCAVHELISLLLSTPPLRRRHGSLQASGLDFPRRCGPHQDHPHRWNRG